MCKLVSASCDIMPQYLIQVAELYGIPILAFREGVRLDGHHIMLVWLPQSRVCTPQHLLKQWFLTLSLTGPSSLQTPVPSRWDLVRIPLPFSNMGKTGWFTNPKWKPLFLSIFGCAAHEVNFQLAWLFSGKRSEKLCMYLSLYPTLGHKQVSFAFQISTV